MAARALSDADDKRRLLIEFITPPRPGAAEVAGGSGCGRGQQKWPGAAEVTRAAEVAVWLVRDSRLDGQRFQWLTV